MTFEEKLERLIERHEALTLTVESIAATSHENTDNIAKLTQNVDKLVEVSNRDAVDISRLAHIAESHEHRIEDLEGGR